MTGRGYIVARRIGLFFTCDHFPDCLVWAAHANRCVINFYSLVGVTQVSYTRTRCAILTNWCLAGTSSEALAAGIGQGVGGVSLGLSAGV